MKSMHFLLIGLLCSIGVNAQQPDSTKQPFHFSGSVSMTHNGLSFIPTFSLGKPAAIFNLSMGRNKLRFEPEMRFALEGKPWSFLFWWRYQLLKNEKFAIRLGAHPAMNFKTQTVVMNGVAKNMIIARRYLAAEVVPNFYPTKNSSIGMYYLYSRGLDNGTAKNTHFITINSTISNIRFGSDLFFKITPQVYYLKMDAQDGYFATSAFGFVKKGFPLSLAAIINKRLRSDITGSKNFVWNTSLVYSFSKN